MDTTIVRACAAPNEYFVVTLSATVAPIRQSPLQLRLLNQTDPVKGSGNPAESEEKPRKDSLSRKRHFMRIIRP